MSRRALSDVIRKYSDAPLVWGDTDCIHFGLEAAHAAGGADHRAMIPNYRTERGALRALRKLPHPTLEGMFDAHLTRVPSAFARPGDVALLHQPPFDCVGVVVGADALFKTDSGVLRYPARELKIWRV